MTSRSPKKLQITRRSTLQILCDHIRPAAALGVSGLLTLVIASSSTDSLDAGVREVLTKPATATRATATATRTAKSAVPRSTHRTADSRIRLTAQTESPLDRLRQRDPEQRFREAIDESSSRPAGYIQPDSVADQPLELPETPADRPKIKAPAAPKTLPDATLQPAEETTLPPEPGPRDLSVPKPIPMDDEITEPATSPAHLKKISEIEPYFDYHPATSLKGEVCWNLCPRPDGSDCKADPETGLVPECPNEFRLSDQAYVARMFQDSCYQWQASDLYHNPLYFEDPALERYGHTHSCLLQPFVSVGKFGAQLAGLPYQMTIDPVRKKMYSLGYYRPGECAPKKYYRIPWNTHAAIAEAGVWTGLIFLFP